MRGRFIREETLSLESRDFMTDVEAIIANR
jgi:hypothetical protein